MNNFAVFIILIIIAVYSSKAFSEKECPSYLIGKWTTISIEDNDKVGPKLGWDITISPSGHCTVVTDDRLNMLYEWIGSIKSNDSILFIKFDRDSNEYWEKWKIGISDNDSIIQITSPGANNWILRLKKSNKGNPTFQMLPKLPRTFNEAVTLLYSELDEQTRCSFLAMTEAELPLEELFYGGANRVRFSLDNGNNDLLFSCDPVDRDPLEASMKITLGLWRMIRNNSDNVLVQTIDLQNAFLISDSMAKVDVEKVPIKILVDSINNKLEKAFEIPILKKTTLILNVNDKRILDKPLYLLKTKSQKVSIWLILRSLKLGYGLTEARTKSSIILNRKKQEE